MPAIKHSTEGKFSSICLGGKQKYLLSWKNHRQGWEEGNFNTLLWRKFSRKARKDERGRWRSWKLSFRNLHSALHERKKRQRKKKTLLPLCAFSFRFEMLDSTLFFSCWMEVSRSRLRSRFAFCRRGGKRSKKVTNEKSFFFVSLSLASLDFFSFQ